MSFAMMVAVSVLGTLWTFGILVLNKMDDKYDKDALMDPRPPEGDVREEGRSSR
jgi:hypothetical protein